MNTIDKNTLKSYFQTGKIPTQANFEALIDYIPDSEKKVVSLSKVVYIDSQDAWDL